MKRKRGSRGAGPRKKPRTESNDLAQNTDHVTHPVLHHYYPTCLTLQQYLERALQTILARGKARNAASVQTLFSHIVNPEVKRILHQVVVARSDSQPCKEQFEFKRDLAVFTQHLPTSTIGQSTSDNESQQIEIVDFVVWLLFRRSFSSRRPQNLLCNGYDWAASAGQHGVPFSAAPGIPGVICNYPNRNVDKVTAPEWGYLLGSLGPHGHRIMIDLLLNCALFEPTESAPGALIQFGGIPMTYTAKPISNVSTWTNQLIFGRKDLLVARTPSDINFVRSRMLYGPYKLTRDGSVRFGLPRVHCLSRHCDAEDRKQTVSVMRYVFPRQFKLHNVFTSAVDPKQTTHGFQDYTLRAGDSRTSRSLAPRELSGELISSRWDDESVPKRLRTRVLHFVKHIQKRAGSCAVALLLDHYCPAVPSMGRLGDAQHGIALQEKTTPVNRVAAFCWAVLSRFLSTACWGINENEIAIKQTINRLVKMRKGETFSLHDALQHLQILSIPWLLPDGIENNHASKFDTLKRKELLAEFVYFIFDSLLIPLIRHNFYVTESNIDRNRLLYFRQDVWRAITTPAMMSIKSQMYTATDAKKYREHQNNSLLSYSRLRLLPKANGLRSISNLRRKPMIYNRRGKKILGQSVNSALTPLYKALLCETNRVPQLIGSSLFSVSGIHQKLKAYRQGLAEHYPVLPKLYFAKLDVQNCFDSVPQAKLLTVMADMLSADAYHIERMAKVHFLGQDLQDVPRVRYTVLGTPVGLALDAEDATAFRNVNLSSDSIIIPGIGQQTIRKPRAMHLLREHVQQNTVRIGKRFYHQRVGIPQGSILSALLCNFLYGKLEQEQFSMILGKDSLLLRLIDDFLLITPDKTAAESFVKTLYEGIPEFGVHIKLEKSLINFELEVNGNLVPRIHDFAFPYCGLYIDVHDLGLSKSSSGLEHEAINNSLSIVYNGDAERMMRQKAVNAFRLQLHAMFLDTALNTLTTVFRNLYRSYHRAALRCLHYWRGLAKYRSISENSLVKTFEELEATGLSVIQRREVVSARLAATATGSSSCTVHPSQNRCIALKAFLDVLHTHQSRHRESLKWIRQEMDVIMNKARPGGSVLLSFLAELESTKS